MQTILGAGGSIGKELAKELATFTDRIRLVGRNPKKVNKTDELFPADLLKPEEVQEAVNGSDVVYLVAGFPYTLNSWKEMWPKAMRNTLNACETANARLVFFDNIYMYDKDHLSPILESAPLNPPSKKGAIRASIVRMLEEEMTAGRVQALIARAPDFYGPDISNSIVNQAMCEPLIAGKKANWFCNAHLTHSFIWTPDAAKATAMLGNDEAAYGQTWHLPTSSEPMTGKKMVEMIAAEAGVKPRYQVAGRFLVRLLGLFDPIMREFHEMLYQFDRDYVFDSGKFMETYDFSVTPYSEGIRQMVAAQQS